MLWQSLSIYMAAILMAISLVFSLVEYLSKQRVVALQPIRLRTKRPPSKEIAWGRGHNVSEVGHDWRV